MSYLTDTLWAIGLFPRKFLGVVFPESKAEMIFLQSILGGQAEKVNRAEALAFGVQTLASELGGPWMFSSRRP